jgi:lipid II isoglutaminyl synthase (glutamine-hydrolysing)
MDVARWVRAPRAWDVRRTIAIDAARIAAGASRASGRRATALPGFIAERIDPGILADLGSRHTPVALVIGTNGKTTTTRLLATILERATGRRPVSNRSGANLSQGIVAALLRARSLASAPRAAVMEVDEFAFSDVAAALRPDVVVILNLVRDQLDRYGEVDAVERRWVDTIRSLPPETTIVACADDPRLVSILSGVTRPVRWFGLAGDGRSAAARRLAPDGPISIGAVQAPCPRCGGATDVDDASASRGAWHCTSCGYDRPAPELAVRFEETDDGSLRLDFALTPATASDVSPEGGYARHELGTACLRLSGTAGAHDAAAAALAVIALGVDPHRVIGAIHAATPAFGRLEEVQVGGRTVVLSLAKNPASVAQAAEAVAMRQPDRVLLGLGDRAADGRDVSWIWDAPLDALLGVAPLTLTGSRADDLALRFKYADATASPGVPPIVEPSIERALNDSLLRVRSGGTLMVLATYTTLLGIRHILERRGLVAAMPR